MDVSLYPDDLLCSGEAVLLEVLSQIEKRVSIQILTVTQDDEETLLLHGPEQTRTATVTMLQLLQK